MYIRLNKFRDIYDYRRNFNVKNEQKNVQKKKIWTSVYRNFYTAIKTIYEQHYAYSTVENFFFFFC